MRNSVIPFFTLLLLAAAGPLPAGDYSIHGTYESYVIGVYNPLFADDFYGYTQAPLDLEVKLSPAEWLDFSLSYSLIVKIIPSALPENILISPGGDTPGYRVIDLPERILPEDDAAFKNIGLYNKLTLLSIAVYLPFADVYLGRQVIAWGSAHIINPTDIFVPRGLSQLDSEKRSGVDAVRFRIPVGMMNEFDIGYVGGDDFKIDKSAVYLRMKAYMLQTDVFLLCMDAKEDLFFGLDMTRSVGDAGAWIESNVVIPDTFSSSGDTPLWDKVYTRISAGMDYNFSNSLYGFFEYHYNSAGKTDPSDYLDIIMNPRDNPAYSKGIAYLLGMHYLGIGITYPITPLLPFSGMLLGNIGDPSLLCSMTLEYNFSENSYLIIGFLAGLGKGPETYNGIITDYKSEFGTYPAVMYTNFQLYF